MFGFLFVCSAVGQMDYKIDGARKVKMGYKPFPKDMQTQALSWNSIESACMESPQFGAWFELQVKGDRAKFNVHTGGNMGNIEDPIIYLGKVVVLSNGRAIQEICCVEHKGNDGVFSIESTGLSKEESYFVLVASKEDKRRFAISTSDDFEAAKPVAKKDPVPALLKIFGRVRNKEGKEQANVKVSLLSEAQQTLATVFTNEQGVFNFEKLAPDQIYLTKIEAEDTELEVDMFLIDEKGSIKSRSTRIGDQLYGFGIDKGLAEFVKLLTPKDYALKVEKGQKGIVGRVVDKQTFLYGKPGVQVGLYNDARQLMSSSVTDKNGVFSFVTKSSENWDVKVTSDQDKDFTEVVIVDELNVPTDVANSDDLGPDGFFKFKSLPRETVELKRMEVKDTRMQLPSDFGDMSVGKSIVLKNILFAYGSADLLPSSYDELDRLAGQLTQMADIKIEVSGHTDNQGTSATNKILSENRAKAVVDYLKRKGIDGKRLTFKGLGETKPIASNETEEGRKMNRRVEFKVVD